jgi:light-regulated signal transduction histidine kinase (bacteriophytochrome)
VASNTGRKIEFHIGDLAPAWGDRALLRQVWINLLGNAVKYTRPRSVAVIDIRSKQEGAMTSWSIADNGVGFDATYTHKLFGVFQRLHSADEFEGTGVGLALVQKVIQRHGGLVRAEGKVGEGATFTFSLPAKPRDNA